MVNREQRRGNDWIQGQRIGMGEGSSRMVRHEREKEIREGWGVNLRLVKRKGLQEKEEE